MLQIPYTVFQEVFSLPGPHAYVVRISDLDRVELVAKTLSGSLQTAGAESLAVPTWDELVPGLKEAIQLDMAAGWLFFFSLILIVAFTVLNTFLMAVLERVKEFCILLAIGCRPSVIALMVCIECMKLTLIGVFFGFGLGIAVTEYFGIVGFSVPGSEEVVKEWNVPAIVFPHVSAASLIRGPAILISAAILSLIFPVAKIFALRPAQAIGTR